MKITQHALRQHVKRCESAGRVRVRDVGWFVQSCDCQSEREKTQCTPAQHTCLNCVFLSERCLKYERVGKERESTNVLQSLQDDHTAALAPSVAVSLVGERVALTSRGDQSGLAEQNEHVGG